MKFLANKKSMLWPLAAGIALFACVSTVLAADPAKNEDTPGFLRKHTWDGSFDRAGDATRNAEIQLKRNLETDCQTFLPDSNTEVVVEATTGADLPITDHNQRMALYDECMRRQQASAQYSQEAASIRKQQRIFADVSRVSDAAAIGSVGATIVSQTVMKDDSQADSLKKVANIQKTAGYASYTTGATDFTLGAIAYIQQKRKLEQMQEAMQTGESGGDPAVNNSLAAAVAETKRAAYNHMLYGAGKAAAGYASMWMAKKNLEQASKLSSIQEATTYAPTTVVQQTPTNSAPVYYQNNQPVFTIDGQSNGVQSSTDQPQSTVVDYSTGSSSGASVMPEFGSGAASSSAGKSSGVSAAAGGSSNNSADRAPSSEPAAEEVNAAAQEAMGNSFELSLTGGLNSYSGSGGSSSGSEEIPNIASIFNGAAPSDGGYRSAATGINPNQIYRDGVANSEEVQSGMSGVNGNRDMSLFAIIKVKHNKMLEVGNVSFPSLVEVKN